MRLFRTIFLLGAIVFLMPAPPEEARRSSLLTPSREVATPQLIDAASRTVLDMGGFCSRQPMVCEAADFIAGRFEARAKYGAKLIYEWANEPSGTKEPEKVTESLPQLADSSAQPSQNTLKVEDLIPDWRDPRPLPKG